MPVPLQPVKHTIVTQSSDLPDGEYLSKTQRKKEMQALQDLGETLARLSVEQLARLDLPQGLNEALLDAKRIRQHEAHRRQLQYIGRLMRSQDATAIAARLADLQGESDASKAQFHALERWRSRLLEDEASLAEWLDLHPGSDIQLLRQLIRNARREHAEGLPPKASRALFRLLRETQVADPGDD